MSKMSEKPLNTCLLDRAIKFAVNAHAGVERRGKGFPYIVHPMEAMAIVATMTSDQNMLAAAALHDTVEDTAITVEDIRREFGDEIAEYVKAETGPYAEAELSVPWRIRKQAAMDRLEQSSTKAKMVALGDKLSNMRAIAADWDIEGDALWDRFHTTGGRPDHEWHYRQLAKVLSCLDYTNAYKEFIYLINHTFGNEKEI